MIWVLHYVVFWMYTHLLGSHIEYVLHRYVMHGGIGKSGRRHLIHHRHTDPSMNIIKRETDEYKILGHAENLIITFKEIRIFSLASLHRLRICFMYSTRQITHRSPAWIAVVVSIVRVGNLEQHTPLRTPSKWPRFYMDVFASGHDESSSGASCMGKMVD